MAGYFEIEFRANKAVMTTTAPTTVVLDVRSLDGYKGYVSIEYEVTNGTVTPTETAVFLDEDEEWHTSVTVSATPVTLTANAHDDANHADTDVISIP